MEYTFSLRGCKALHFFSISNILAVQHSKWTFSRTNLSSYSFSVKLNWPITKLKAKNIVFSFVMLTFFL